MKKKTMAFIEKKISCKNLFASGHNLFFWYMNFQCAFFRAKILVQIISKGKAKVFFQEKMAE